MDKNNPLHGWQVERAGTLWCADVDGTQQLITPYHLHSTQDVKIGCEIGYDHLGKLNKIRGASPGWTRTVAIFQD